MELADGPVESSCGRRAAERARQPILGAEFVQRTSVTRSRQEIVVH